MDFHIVQWSPLSSKTKRMRWWSSQNGSLGNSRQPRHEGQTSCESAEVWAQGEEGEEKEGMGSGADLMTCRAVGSSALSLCLRILIVLTSFLYFPFHFFLLPTREPEPSLVLTKATSSGLWTLLIISFINNLHKFYESWIISSNPCFLKTETKHKAKAHFLIVFTWPSFSSREAGHGALGFRVLQTAAFSNYFHLRTEGDRLLKVKIISNNVF